MVPQGDRTPRGYRVERTWRPRDGNAQRRTPSWGHRQECGKQKDCAGAPGPTQPDPHPDPPISPSGWQMRSSGAPPSLLWPQLHPPSTLQFTEHPAPYSGSQPLLSLPGRLHQATRPPSLHITSTSSLRLSDAHMETQKHWLSAGCASSSWDLSSFPKLWAQPGPWGAEEAEQEGE